MHSLSSPIFSIIAAFAILATAACDKTRAETPADIIERHEAEQAESHITPRDLPEFPEPALAPRRGRAGLVNFGADDQPWLKKLRELARTRKGQFRILMLGDSHTAGGYLGDAARARLQKRLGDAGIGFVQPNHVRTQHVPLMKYEGDWPTRTSRGEADFSPFPLGGIMAHGGGAGLRLMPQEVPYQPMRLKIVARRDPGAAPLYVRDGKGRKEALPPDNAKDSGWLSLEVPRMRPPFTFLDPDEGWDLGLVGMENGRPGVIFSALGINGAQITELGHWRRDWPQDLSAIAADLVILEYGTNEAYQKSEVNLPALEAQWRRVLGQVRRALPEAGILIIGAPEALDNVEGSCGVRPRYLDAVQAMQERLARRNRLLYWSWQEALGGPCSMKPLMERGLAARDGVHFAKEGYHKIGTMLADALLGLSR